MFELFNKAVMTTKTVPITKQSSEYEAIINQICETMASIGKLNIGIIYCNEDVFIFKILIFIIRIFYLDIQTIYSSTYCSIFRNRRYFSFSMALCNIISGLSIWKMKVYFGISK